MSLSIAVLISGQGSTLANLAARIDDGRLPGVRIVRVIASRAAIGGVEFARRAAIACDVIRPRDFARPDAFAAAVGGALRASGAQLAVMGGYLVRLPIPPAYERRVLNVHPALLPAFGGVGMYGRRVHEAVLRSGAAETGCTVHLADDHYDHGPIIAQARTAVLPGDTPDSLAARVGELERELYPSVIGAVARHGLAWLDQPDRWPAAVTPAVAAPRPAGQAGTP